MQGSVGASGFGELLRSLRLAAGLTQQALAVESGVARRTIQDLERDVGRPQRVSVDRLVAVLRPTPAVQAALERATSAPRRRTHRRMAEAPTDGEATSAGHVRLPTPLTSFVGRERELAELASLLATHRLLTLTGPGGSGKTRLALELAPLLADRFPDGVTFVSLAPLADPSLIASSIAEALGIRESPEQSVTASLTRSIGAKRMLLVLDNFEHLLAGASLVADLLSACPRLAALVTSRELLRLSGEQVFEVAPLTVPDLADVPASDGERLVGFSRSEAFRLFVERAGSVQASFSLEPASAMAVAALCVRLEGLPLAIELAAARVRLLPPAALVERMQRRLPVLTDGPRDAPARQRTLRDAIAWSYELLDDGEQRLLQLLSVFVGGATLDAVDRVASSESRVASGSLFRSLLATHDSLLEALASLVDKSLVRVVVGPDGEPRYTMLETIREFAVEQLEASGLADDVRRHHAAYFLAFAERARPELRGPDALRWLARFDAEHDNVRAAMTWGAARGEQSACSDAGGAALSGFDLASRTARACIWYWVHYGMLRQVREWTDAMLAQAQSGTPAYARLLTVRLAISMYSSNVADSRRIGEACLSSWRALDDPHEIAATLVRLAHLEAYGGDPLRARVLLDESQQLVDDDRRVADAEFPPYLIRASSYKQAGDLDTAERLFDWALVRARQDGDLHTVHNVLRPLGIIAGLRGDMVRSRRVLADAVRAGQTYGCYNCLLGTLAFVGIAAVDGGHLADGVCILAFLMRSWDHSGYQPLGMSGEVEAALERARAVLSETAFAAALTEGRGMNRDQACARAMRLADEPADVPQDVTFRATTRPMQDLRAPGQVGARLTPRETEVARLLARGLTNRQIADELVISARTAGSHVYRLMGKLGCSSRAQVAAWAVANSLCNAE